MYKLVFKRLFDIFLATLLFFILLPIFVVVALLLFYNNKGKIFFIQARPGYKAKNFRIIKFKTMHDSKDKDNKILPDEQRVHKFGKFIRKYSLDEIPQLINVIVGDMSIVGPRPLLPEYMPLYSDFQKQRHLVKPGITGWAQINGRNAISWQEKFKFDVWYVENFSFPIDLKIIFLTTMKVIEGKDVSTHGYISSEPFKGN